MRVINLASGSDGNITYIETEDKKFLLDIGLSCKETVGRLEKIGVNPNEISAVLVSHEHSDHIKGADIFCSKYDIPLYAHEKVWMGLEYKLKKVPLSQRKLFDGDFSIGGCDIVPVEVPHDVSCFGYSFIEKQNKISVITDLGHINDNILSSIEGSKLVYLEANYDKEMLMKGKNYPLSLKMRIDGPNGHLSNVASGDVATFLTMTGTRQIVLAHLSHENNTPPLAYTTICKHLEGDGIIEGEDVKIDVATRNIGSFFKLK